MRAGAASNIGEVHLEFSQPNQDNYLINTDHKIFAVFDGHGDNGHVISAYLKDNLASTVKSASSPSLSVEDSLKSAFQTLDDNICKESNSESSGSTCVMAYLENDHLYVAGVGDCSALLVKVNPTSGKVETTSLVTSHKITNKAEHERITQTGAAIAGDYIVSKTDPNKVINMTRAFGDQDMKSSGIIATPEISKTKLTTKNNNNQEPATKKLKVDQEPDGNNKENDNENNHENNKENGKESTDENTNNTNSDGKTNNNENITANGHSDTNHDSFLLLFSDGLEQVQSNDDIAQKAHELLRANLKEEDQVPISTICKILLQKLEDGVVERDGVGFNDDATVIVVLLSGF